MAITYGMSVKEFWEDSPDLFWAYRFSYFNRKEEEQKLFNYNAWLQGGYICEAVQVAIANCFGKKKFSYLSQPLGTNKQPKQTESEKLVLRIKERVAQVQAIKGDANTGTVIKGEPRTVKK